MSSIAEDLSHGPASLAAQPSQEYEMAPITESVFTADSNGSLGAPQEPQSGLHSSTIDMAKHDAPEAEPEANPNAATGEKKKKRKKRNKATSMPKNRGTGFEEFYADPPITPEEAAEELAIYSPLRSFSDRIEECINRFRGRRRLQGDLVRYFDEYLFLGGIDSHQRDFQGVDPKEYAAATAEEKRQLANVYGIHGAGDNPKFYNPAQPENWSVNFSAVVSGYLSEGVRRVAWHKDNAEAETPRAIGVVENFLRYILQHDVCNEYKDDITNALELCERGREELPLTLKASGRIPCEFNAAAAKIFEGGREFEFNPKQELKEEMTEVEEVFVYSLVFFGPREVYDQLKSLRVVRIVNKEPCSLKILSITLPSEREIRMSHLYRGCRGGVGGVNCGVIRFKHVLVRDDLCRGNVEQVVPDRIEELIVEERLLELLRPGFIIRVTLAELNIGLKIMTNLPEILPSFYCFLPQIMMRYYKAPCPNPRPAPSALGPVDRDGEGVSGKDEDVEE
ncbi:uncharacterized protein DNG_02538 [Cephalotrichum gorgonifer]|uniref:Uncharacterized protein n=1 Tax=Cephalotrichum gorgonifer TaxID=2041049 RepID=A0AAE8MTR0_9PEZI|nr:uncharacterized protein DNG_02538 [Cephalotrichum gorgonifer]